MVKTALTRWSLHRSCASRHPHGDDRRRSVSEILRQLDDDEVQLIQSEIARVQSLT